MDKRAELASNRRRSEASEIYRKRRGRRRENATRDIPLVAFLLFAKYPPLSPPPPTWFYLKKPENGAANIAAIVGQARKTRTALRAPRVSSPRHSRRVNNAQNTLFCNYKMPHRQIRPKSRRAIGRPERRNRAGAGGDLIPDSPASPLPPLRGRSPSGRPTARRKKKSD